MAELILTGFDPRDRSRDFLKLDNLLHFKKNVVLLCWVKVLVVLFTAFSQTTLSSFNHFVPQHNMEAAE